MNDADADTRIKVQVRQRTKPVSRAPRITGVFTSGDPFHTSRKNNKDVMWKHPEILEYIKSQLSADLMQTRKTLRPESNNYIVPVLNTTGGTAAIKYIFGQAQYVQPLYPWERINGTDWYVINAASYWTPSKSISILVGTSVVGGYIHSDSVIKQCINIRYYQFHTYCYDRLSGRCNKYCY